MQITEVVARLEQEQAGETAVALAQVVATLESQITDLHQQLHDLVSGETGQGNSGDSSGHTLGLCQDAGCEQCSGTVAAIAQTAQEAVFENLDLALTEIGADLALRTRLIAAYNKVAEGNEHNHDHGHSHLGQDSGTVYIKQGDQIVPVVLSGE